MKLSELMTENVRSCSVHDNLERAAEIMWNNDCGCVPVVDDAERVVGILTDRDVCMAGYTQGKVYAEIPVTTAMATQVFSASEHDPVETAEALMREKQIRRLPIVDGGGKLRGLLSLNDIARQAPRAAGRRGNGTSTEAVAQTLAAISQPHGSNAERKRGADRGRD